MRSLQSLGWSASFAAALADLDDPSLTPARVVTEQRNLIRAETGEGVLDAAIAGRLRHTARSAEDLPAVGDWVALRARAPDSRALVVAVLPRRTRLVRTASTGRTEAQVVAANVDAVFLVTSLNRDFNPRRIERYLEAIRAGGADPVVVLSKADLVPDPGTFRAEAERVSRGAAVCVISALDGTGLDGLDPWLAPARTAALVGSSGVGKSTLVNRLLGKEAMVVREIREDDTRGRHTTTYRHLITLPGGAMLVDTPGLRAIAAWDTGEPDDGLFPEIEAAAGRCRFNDCRHAGEPGCGVRAALEAGEIDADRLESWRTLRRERAFLARKQNVRKRLEEARRWKRISKIRRKMDRRQNRWQ